MKEKFKPYYESFPICSTCEKETNKVSKLTSTLSRHCTCRRRPAEWREIKSKSLSHWLWFWEGSELGEKQ